MMKFSASNVSIVCMIGLPGSGKSHLCKAIQMQLKTQQRLAAVGTLIIEYDEIESLSAFSAFNPSEKLQLCEDGLGSSLTKYKIFRRLVLRIIEAVIRRILFDDLLDLPESVVTGLSPYLTELLRVVQGSRRVVLMVDDNMYYRSMRYSLYQIAKKYGLGYGQIYLDVPLEVCMRRNASRTGSACISEDVIANMSTRLEPPDSSRFTWESSSLCLTPLTEGDIDSICEFLQTVLDKPVSVASDLSEGQREESRVITSQDVVHQADLVLRQLVKLSITSPQSAVATDKQSLAAQANNARRAVLRYVRHHSSEISESLCQSSNPGMHSGLSPISGQSTTTELHTGQSTTAGLHTGQSTTTGLHTGQSTTTGLHTGQSTTTGLHTGQSTNTELHKFITSLYQSRLHQSD